MTAFEKIVIFLRFEMEKPASYGLFHIAFLLLTVATTAFLIWKFRDADEKTVRRILLGAWITLFLLEIYKQIVFSYNANIYVPDYMEWRYQWEAFPFQLCLNLGKETNKLRHSRNCPFLLFANLFL